VFKEKEKILKWGVVGCGQAATFFLNTFDKNLNSRIVSVSSKSKYNFLQQNSKNFDIFSNYEEHIQSKNTDIIYISLINSMHSEIIELCIKNNKHIVVEKPSSLNFQDLKTTLKKLNDKNIFFKESVLYLSHPITCKILEVLNNGDIGKVIKINASFGFNFVKKKFLFFKRKKKYNQNIFNKDLGGGAIYNYAHYPLSAIKTFSLGCNLLDLGQIKSNSYIGHTGVDEHSFLNVKFLNGMESSIELAINKNLISFLEIVGEKGSIYVNNPWSPGQFFSIKVDSKNKGKKTYDYTSDRSMWSYEVESVEKDIFSNNRESSIDGVKISDSLLYLKFIDKWKKISLQNKN
tara:strand:+ start:135 stop:1175 length:1041 start_codon:yes stop_codon:yes gene_type:complete